VSETSFMDSSIPVGASLWSGGFLIGRCRVQVNSTAKVSTTFFYPCSTI
jgi:hypothetical protein